VAPSIRARARFTPLAHTTTGCVSSAFTLNSTFCHRFARLAVTVHSSLRASGLPARGRAYETPVHLQDETPVHLQDNFVVIGRRVDNDHVAATVHARACCVCREAWCWLQEHCGLGQRVVLRVNRRAVHSCWFRSAGIASPRLVLSSTLARPCCSARALSALRCCATAAPATQASPLRQCESRHSIRCRTRRIACWQRSGC